MSPPDDLSTIDTPTEGTTGIGGAPAPSVASVTAAFAQWRSACKKRVQRSQGIMSPMDENPWFATPTVTGYQIQEGQSILVLNPNPMRVGVIFSMQFASNVYDIEVYTGPSTGTIPFAKENLATGEIDLVPGDPSGSWEWFQPVHVPAITLSPTTTTGKLDSAMAAAGGLNITNNGVPLQLTQSEWGPLPAMGWIAAANVDLTGQNANPYVFTLSIVELLLRAWPEVS